MRKYYHYNCNTENDEDTIKGNELELLWDVCFKYSEFFSVSFIEPAESINFFHEFQKNAIEVRKTNEWPGTRLITIPPNLYAPYVAILPCNDETRRLISLVSNNLIEFVNCWGLKNPEDPAFYRKDGTPFFSTTIHEGYFAINADENEDISEILSKRVWEETEPWKFRDKVWFK